MGVGEGGGRWVLIVIIIFNSLVLVATDELDARTPIGISFVRVLLRCIDECCCRKHTLNSSAVSDNCWWCFWDGGGALRRGVFFTICFFSVVSSDVLVGLKEPI